MKIERIDLIPVEYPFRGEFRISRGSVGSAALGRQTVIAKLTTENGTVGWGESAPIRQWSYETLESVYSTLSRYLVPAVLGADLFDLDGLHRRMDAEIAPGYTLGQPIARAAIDIAAHDALGKMLGVSLSQYWGTARLRSVPLSWTVAVPTLEKAEEAVEEGRAAGYSHFNIKVGSEDRLDFDIALARYVRQAAPDGFLWADANGGYSVQTAKEAARRLADAGADVLEQPIPINAVSGYRELRRLNALPVAVDEGIVSPRDLIEWIRLDLIDGIAMKPMRVGGLYPQRRLIETALDAGLMFLGSGLTDPDIGFAASVQIYAAYGLKYPAALNGPQFLSASAASKGVQVENGCAHVPDSAGLGIEMDESALERMRIEVGF